MVKKRIIAVLLWFAGGFAFIQSLHVTVAWWKGEIAVMTLADWFWVAMLPVLLYLYFRYVSIFRCKEPACLRPPEDRP